MHWSEVSESIAGIDREVLHLIKEVEDAVRTQSLMRSLIHLRPPSTPLGRQPSRQLTVINETCDVHH